MTQPAVPVTPSPRLPRQQILELFRTASQVQCFWATRKRPPTAGQRPLTEHAWIDLSLSAFLSFGVDELRQQYDSTLDQNDSLQVAQRGVTVTCRACSFDASLEGYDLCERVRFRLRTQTARAIMVPTMALRDIPPTVALPDQEREGRLLSCASMDVRLLYVLSQDPGDPGEGGYIESVNGGGIIPGTPLP